MPSIKQPVKVLLLSLFCLASASTPAKRDAAVVTKTVTVSQCTATVTSCPKFANPCKSPKVITDTFENYTAAILPALTPIGISGGLEYSGFNVDESEGLGLGVIPHSGNLTAAASLLTGVVQFGSVTLTPFGTITTDGTGTAAFELTQFYFACGQNTAEAVTTVPIACEIGVAGYTTAGKQVGVATYSYSAPDLTLDPMMKVFLPTRFRGQLLHNVTFGLTGAAVNGAVSVLLLDDVKHSNCA